MIEPEPYVVAIVDDDPDVRHSLSFLLEVLGHPVQAFASAAEFLKADIQRMACLILDHHMPGMTGLHLAECLREEGSLIPIMLITGSLSPHITTQAAQLGIHRVFEKPLIESDLINFVETSSRHIG